MDDDEEEDAKEANEVAADAFNECPAAATGIRDPLAGNLNLGGVAFDEGLEVKESCLFECEGDTGSTMS